MLKLMYITNEPDIAVIAENAGVDRIWIDLEVNGKEERQKNLDTVKSKHKISDIAPIKKVLKKANLIVRVNSIYEGSEKEINEVIEQGAEIVMLPYFKTVEEVEKFIKFVNKRAKVCLLVETPEAVEKIDEILSLDGIDEVHIGLNDLHLGYKMNFMFELLADGTVDKLCKKFKAKNIPYGFGGVSRVGTGTLPAEHIIIEHYRLGSQIVILSRSFCNTQKITDRKEIKELFDTGVRDIRKTEQEAMKYTEKEFEDNRKNVINEVNQIVMSINNDK